MIKKRYICNLKHFLTIFAPEIYISIYFYKIRGEHANECIKSSLKDDNFIKKTPEEFDHIELSVPLVILIIFIELF